MTDSPISLQTETWCTTLAECCLGLMAEMARPVVLCVMGPSGTGKSTLGKRLRQQGLPGIPPRQVAVIDDGRMRANLFGFIRREVRFPSSQRDELAPFYAYLKGKRLVVYVNTNPAVRLSSCDIVLRLVCSEETRRARLLGRNADGEDRYQLSLLKPPPGDIPARYVFELNVEKGN